METNQKDKIIVVRVVEIIQWVVKKLWVIVLTGVLFGIAGYGYASMTEEPPMYMTTSKLYITGVESAVPSTAGMNLGQQVLSSYIEILESKTVLEQVIENLNLNMTYKELQSCISEYIPEGTSMLEISVSFPEPEWAKKVADELVAVSAARALEIMGCTAPKVYEEAYVPTEPYNMYGSSSAKYMLIGAVAGIVLAGFAVLVSYFVNVKITSPYRVTDRIHIPVLGVIPDSSEKNRGYEEAAYRGFCSQLLAGNPNYKIFEFVHATKNENQYEFLLKVAENFKKTGKKVMLMDVNLSNPKWGAVDRTDGEKKGLEAYLREEIELEDIVVKKDGINYIYCKEAVIDAPRLLYSDKYQELLEKLQENYDYILINEAPLNYVPDAVCGKKMDSTIIMALSGKINKIGQAKKMKSMYLEHGLEVDGAVLLDMDIQKGGKYFSKEFGKYFGVYEK